ncbi:hypothetical protein A8709_31390 [Paenibacillus pectinilyticus]|uniref:Uncharacterized protein n=1 Tax=Paenibacillus pectinilyticus TaxID=512399 RepID=A0A1C0ZW54_9BACL|nr:spore germination protein [Paenibacillus pectinilyticus]OCT12336.1 hypothetical protein A8709_31390 [Paenibacillus pectinilyticus]
MTTNQGILVSTLEMLKGCADLTHQHFPLQQFDLVYFDYFVGTDILDREIIAPLTAKEPNHVALLSRSFFKPKLDVSEIVDGILSGKIAVFYNNRAYLYDAYAPEIRSIQNSETESVINGPMDSFNESLATNLSLIRRRIKNPSLKVVNFTIGTKTKTPFALLYMEGIADASQLQQLSDMIDNLDIPAVYDTNTLVQYLGINKFTIFPQILTTVRPDLISDKLINGKLVGLLDGSPVAFSAPTGFIEFFSSPDDYYLSWATASLIRLLRLLALFITLCFTAFYVSLVTYHYEMIPATLILNLMESRDKVPFSPLFEALLMELTIEFLREAGARLPSKIGSTIGTVGGIVIGQAAVQAGVTSNILIISVAISAIASFVIPSYIMSSSIRFMRFSIIIMAGLLGNFGIMIAIGFICIQLSGYQTLGHPFLLPFSPTKPYRMLDQVIRIPVYLLQRLNKKKPSNSNE